MQINTLTCIPSNSHYFVEVYLSNEDLLCKIHGKKDYIKALESDFYG